MILTKAVRQKSCKIKSGLGEEYERKFLLYSVDRVDAIVFYCLHEVICRKGTSNMIVCVNGQDVEKEAVRGCCSLCESVRKDIDHEKIFSVSVLSQIRRLTDFIK